MWEDEFDTFYRDAKTYRWLLRKENDGREEKNLILYHDRKKGSYSNVYPTTFDENGNKVAMKVLRKTDRISDLTLFYEFKLHKALYDKYIECKMEPKCVKPLWLRWIRFNGAHRVLCMGMEPFDATFFEHLLKHGKHSLKKFKSEILNELIRLNTTWNFFHRDLHISNVGMKNDKWLLFDFGMSIYNEYEPYQTNDLAFYPKHSIPSLSHDKRLFLFSWHTNIEKDDDYYNGEIKKIASSDVDEWSHNMPVLLKNHPLTENGIFLYEEEDGKLLIELNVSMNTIKKRRIGNTCIKTGGMEKKIIHCSFNKEDVLPNITYEYIHYYVPTLI